MAERRSHSRRTLNPARRSRVEPHPRALQVLPVVLRTRAERQSFRDSYIIDLSYKVRDLTYDVPDPDGVIKEALSQMVTLCVVARELHEDVDFYRSVLMGVERAHRDARAILDSREGGRTERRYSAALQALGLTKGKSKPRIWPQSPGTLLLYLALRWGATDPSTLRDTATLLRAYSQIGPCLVRFLSQTAAEWDDPLAMPSKLEIENGRRWKPLDDLEALDLLHAALGAGDRDAVRVQIADDEAQLNKRLALDEPGDFARRLHKAHRALPARSKRKK